MGRLPHQIVRHGQKDMDTDGLALLVEKLQKACGEPWDGLESTGEEVRDGGTLYRQERWNGIQEITQGGSTSGDGTIVVMCGIKSLRHGLAKKPG